MIKLGAFTTLATIELKGNGLSESDFETSNTLARESFTSVCRD